MTQCSTKKHSTVLILCCADDWSSTVKWYDLFQTLLGDDIIKIERHKLPRLSTIYAVDDPWADTMLY